MIRRPPRSTRTDTLFPYATLFRSQERLLRIPASGVGKQVERPVVDARRIVDIEAVVIVVGAAERDAVEGRVFHVAQRLARCLEDLAADQDVVLDVIRRASCRARGCAEEYIWVVVVPVKKKKESR